MNCLGSGPLSRRFAIHLINSAWTDINGMVDTNHLGRDFPPDVQACIHREDLSRHRDQNRSDRALASIRRSPQYKHPFELLVGRTGTVVTRSNPVLSVSGGSANASSLPNGTTSQLGQ